MAHTKQPHLLVFDSGVGGLSIVDAIKQSNPSYQLTYASDNAYFPYGTKTESALISRVEQVLTALQKEIKADIIIVACNTASTLVLPKIRANFTQPIIGVVPAIKPAAEISETKVIGLLATPGTVDRKYTKGLIKDFASECDVISVGSSELVILAEQKLQNKAVPLEELRLITAPFRDNSTQNRPDTLVLACTHFPLLKEELMLVLPDITYWVDSGDAIARRVQFWVSELDLTHQHTLMTTPEKGLSIFTKKTEETQLIAPTLSKLNLDCIRYMEIG